KSHEFLFLGRGFRWEAKHTQRLFDTKLPQNAHFLKQGNFYRLARAFENKFSNAYLAKLSKSSHFLNPVKPQADVGGNAQLHGVELFEENVLLPLKERVGHTLVLGTTRVGKTRLLEVLVTQDIHRGETVIVFDPKGDAELLRRLYFEAERSGRLDDFIIFHLGFPENSARYNPIGHFARITEVANRVANQLPGTGESLAFKEFGWRFVNIIAKALVALGRIPDYKQIAKHILKIDALLVDYCEFWLPTVDVKWQSKVDKIQGNIKSQELPQNLRN